jgi:hypothetical protein
MPRIVKTQDVSSTGRGVRQSRIADGQDAEPIGQRLATSGGPFCCPAVTRAS